MENVIVEMLLAATGETVDFMLPAHVTVGKMMADLIQIVEQMYQQITYSGEQPLLYSKTEGRLIPLDVTLAQAHVQDGHQLILV